MRTTFCTCLAACALAACAAPATVPQAAAARAWYCAEDRLAPNGDALTCNWQPSAVEACRYANSSTLSRAALAADPQPAGRCASGQWLVKATPA